MEEAFKPRSHGYMTDVPEETWTRTFKSNEPQHS